VFPLRYGLDLYILFRRNSVLKCLRYTLKMATRCLSPLGHNTNLHGNESLKSRVQATCHTSQQKVLPPVQAEDAMMLISGLTFSQPAIMARDFSVNVLSRSCQYQNYTSDLSGPLQALKTASFAVTRAEVVRGCQDSY
jgi:hypothetical protein